MAYTCGMEFIETSVFTRQVLSLLTENEYSGLQVILRENPACGDVIRGGGGIRKVRYAAQTKGKSGGVRVIYYWATAQGQIYLLLIYPKSRKDTLNEAEVRTLRKLVEEWLHG